MNILIGSIFLLKKYFRSETLSQSASSKTIRKMSFFSKRKPTNQWKISLLVASSSIALSQFKQVNNPKSIALQQMTSFWTFMTLLKTNSSEGSFSPIQSFTWSLTTKIQSLRDSLQEAWTATCMNSTSKRSWQSWTKKTNKLSKNNKNANYSTHHTKFIKLLSQENKTEKIKTVKNLKNVHTTTQNCQKKKS
jgi:hypothetical protein